MSSQALRRRPTVPVLVTLALLSAACAKGGEVKSPTPTSQPSGSASVTPCLANPKWISSPNPPLEIGNGVPVGDETNCQFQQFAYQWFLALVQPSPTVSGERVFETFRVYQPGQKNQCNTARVSGKAAAAKALFVRTLKKDDASVEPVLPEDIKQATGEALYDQKGNVVFYNILYNDTECQATSAGFQPNTIEIKTSWRIMNPRDPSLSSYYVMTAVIPSISPQPLTLAMVGFHLVTNTKNHPEFVWATFEHKSNAPDCTNPQAAPATGWSFLSSSCAQCLTGQCPTQCSFNTGIESKSLTGTPNEVCRVYRDGTDPGSTTGGNDNDTNRANIDMLNTQLVGPAGFLTALPASNPLAVFKNYYMVGSLWTDGGVASTTPNAQRGSLELANLTMETFFQQANQNCFTCHGYNPQKPLDVSHIVDGLISTTSAPKQ